MSERYSRLPDSFWRPPPPVNVLPSPEGHYDGDYVNVRNEVLYVWSNGDWWFLSEVESGRTE